MATPPTVTLPPVPVPKNDVPEQVTIALASNPKKITLEKIDENTYMMTIVL